MVTGTDADDTLIGSGEHETLRGFAGNDVLRGGDGHDRLYGGTGDDILQGGTKGDTYYYDIGDGHDTLFDKGLTILSGHSSGDKLVFGAGINPGDVIVTRHTDDADDVTLTFAGFDGSIFLDEHLRGGGEYGLEAIEFADGTVWSRQRPHRYRRPRPRHRPVTTVLVGSQGADVIDGLAGADEIRGWNGADTLTGGLGDDLLAGETDGDTYHYAVGDGGRHHPRAIRDHGQRPPSRRPAGARRRHPARGHHRHPPGRRYPRRPASPSAGITRVDFPRRTVRRRCLRPGDDRVRRRDRVDVPGSGRRRLWPRRSPTATTLRPRARQPRRSARRRRRATTSWPAATATTPMSSGPARANDVIAEAANGGSDRLRLDGLNAEDVEFLQLYGDDRDAIVLIVETGETVLLARPGPVGSGAGVRDLRVRRRVDGDLGRDPGCRRRSPARMPTTTLTGSSRNERSFDGRGRRRRDERGGYGQRPATCSVSGPVTTASIEMGLQNNALGEQRRSDRPGPGST